MESLVVLLYRKQMFWWDQNAKWLHMFSFFVVFVNQKKWTGNRLVEALTETHQADPCCDILQIPVSVSSADVGIDGSLSGGWLRGPQLWLSKIRATWLLSSWLMIRLQLTEDDGQETFQFWHADQRDQKFRHKSWETVDGGDLGALVLSFCGDF